MNFLIKFVAWAVELALSVLPQPRWFHSRARLVRPFSHCQQLGIALIDSRETAGTNHFHSRMTCVGINLLHDAGNMVSHSELR